MIWQGFGLPKAGKSAHALPFPNGVAVLAGYDAGHLLKWLSLLVRNNAK